MPAQRGRKGQKIDLVPLERPQPPADLSESEAQIWRNTVNRLPADWFPAETHPLLANYCRHAALADWLNERIRAAVAREDDPKEMETLLKQRDREVKGMSTLATRMRVSQQASFDAKKSRAGRRTGGEARPWQS